jgi:O-antigen ligase
MRRLIQIPQGTADRISFFHLAAFLTTLPFDRFFSQLILISFIVHTLIHSRASDYSRLLAPRNFILASIFIVTLIGMSFTPEFKQAGKDLQRQLAILLIPFIFTLSRFPWSACRHSLMNIFGFVCTALIIYLYIDAFRIIHYYDLPIRSILSLAFMNHNFSAPVGIHATYLALYAGLSLVYFSWQLLQENQHHRWIYISCIMVLLIGLLQLASRSVLIGIAFSACCIPFFIPAGFKRRKFILYTLAIALVAILGILNIDSFRVRYISTLQDDLTQASINNDLLEPRAQRWQLGWEIAAQKPVTGHGSGTEKQLLKEAYYENGLYNSFLHELNAHNQYLSLWIKTGLWGLLIYLLTLFYGLYRARAKQDLVFFAFLVMVAITGFSENLLDVNKGIFFYAFFFSFFVYAGKPLNPFNRLDINNGN